MFALAFDALLKQPVAVRALLLPLLITVTNWYRT